MGSEGALSSTLSPIKISDSVAFQPTKSTTVSLSAAIGSTSGAEGINTSTATAYDSKGNAQEVSLNWKQSSTDPLVWTVSNSADSSNSATVKFNSDGSLASVNGASQSTGSAATFSYTGLQQDMTVSLGTIGSTSGVSLATDSSNYSTNPTMTTDSVTSGTFTGLSMQSDGSVMATFDNGLSQLLAKIPLSTFADPNGLSAQNGQAYTATASSGAPTVNAVNTNGAGTLSTSSTESSTTDLTSDLTKLIVAQQAYGANTKIVTTANQLLQTTLAMIQ